MKYRLLESLRKLFWITLFMCFLVALVVLLVLTIKELATVIVHLMGLVENPVTLFDFVECVIGGVGCVALLNLMGWGLDQV